jgi:DNA-binding MarR family transcriptional regulator
MGLVLFDYESKIQHWVNRLSFLLRSEVQRNLAAQGFDLSAEEWALLMILWFKGPQQMGPLAAITLRDRTTVTRLVDRLVKKGYVARAEVAQDRRQILISVTELGHQIEDKVVAAIKPLIQKSQQGISPEDAEIAMSVLKKMTQNLDGG